MTVRFTPWTKSSESGIAPSRSRSLSPDRDEKQNGEPTEMISAGATSPELSRSHSFNKFEAFPEETPPRDLSSDSSSNSAPSPPTTPPPFLSTKRGSIPKVRRIRASSISKHLQTPDRIPRHEPPTVPPLPIPHQLGLSDSIYNLPTITPRAMAPVKTTGSPLEIHHPRMSAATLSLSMSLKAPQKKSAFSKPQSKAHLTLVEREKILSLQTEGFHQRMLRAYNFLNDRRLGIPLSPVAAATMIQRAWRAHIFRTSWRDNLFGASNCIVNFKAFIRAEHMFFAQLSALISVLTPISATSRSLSSTPFGQLVTQACRIYEIFSSYIQFIKNVSFPLLGTAFPDACASTLLKDVLPLLNEYTTLLPEGLLSFAKLLKDDKKFSKTCNTETIKELLPSPVTHYRNYRQFFTALSMFPLTRSFDLPLAYLGPDHYCPSPKRH